MSVLKHPAHVTAISETGNRSYSLEVLQTKLLQFSLFNFFLLSVVGIVLRAYPLTAIPFFQYKNVLHAHSHFAFGGWVIPALTFLVIKFFPELSSTVAYRHWRNIIVLLFISAYGMLLSFPFQGYGAISILFSTLSILASFYLGIVIWKAARKFQLFTSHYFLLAGLFFCFISAIGPFSTAPLIAMGKAGTPLYFNAIYFYLHFQYNGFFTFTVLAVLYKLIEQNKPVNNGKLVFRLLSFACIPTYFLSVLWTEPSLSFYIIGGSAALLQLAAVAWLLKDIKAIGWKSDWQGWLFRIAIFVFIIKNVLQLLSAFPSIARLAFQNRNFIIAYLHLVLLGFISIFIFSVVLKTTTSHFSKILHRGLMCFLFAFLTTELLLVIQAGGYLSFFNITNYLFLLFGLSLFFPAGLWMIWLSYHLQYRYKKNWHLVGNH